MLKRFISLYPVRIIGSPLLGLFQPQTLAWFGGPWVTWVLMIVMLGMEFSLTPDDFRLLFPSPGALALGPILVASCPSGTASNVIAFLPRANVALAVQDSRT